MRRVAVVGIFVLVAVIVGCSEDEPTTAGSDRASSETIDPAETTTSTSVGEDPAEWLEAIRTGGADPAIVESVEFRGDWMVIQTTLGRHDDELNQGEGATVCFAAQNAGWTGYIEVLARSGGPLAVTRNVPAGLTCMGSDR